MINAIDDALQLYQEVCGLAALVEFKMRLLAENQLNFQAEKLEVIEEILIEWLQEGKSQEQFEHWKTVRQLRNKVLHSEFQQARNKLQALGHKTGNGFVKKFNIEGMNTSEILSTVFQAKNNNNSFPFVSDQNQKDVGILAWLLELYNAVDLELAKKVFQSVSNDLDKLIQSSGEEE